MSDKHSERSFFKMKKLTGFPSIALTVILVSTLLTGCDLFGGGSEPTPSAPDGSNPEVLEWYDETGYAVRNDPSTPRFMLWIETHIRATYPNATIQNFGSWMQATLPGGLIVSWAEWGDESLTLGQVDGLYEGKPLFVAMRDYAPWVEDQAVTHVECSGTYIHSYNATRMSGWDVHQSTILQFDGNADEFVSGLTQAWNAVRLNLGGCPES
jgi:hypothetical protein